VSRAVAADRAATIHKKEGVSGNRFLRFECQVVPMGTQPNEADADAEADGPAVAPGPSRWALARLVPGAIQSDPVELAVELRERYGHVVRIPPVYPGLDEPAYLLTHPDDVQHVLQTNAAEFRGLDVPGAADFEKVVEDSIVSLTEDSEAGSWVDRLRMLSPEFGEGRVAEHAPRFAAETLVTLDEFDPTVGGRPPDAPSGRAGGLLGGSDDPARVQADQPDAVRLLALTRRLSLRLLGVALLGPDVRAHEATVIRAVTSLRDLFKRRQLAVVGGAVSSRLPEQVGLPDVLGRDVSISLPGGDGADVGDAIGTLADVADLLVDRRERSPRPYDDALSTWLTRPDQTTGEVLDVDTVRAEAIGMLLAGFGTLSAALAWTLVLAALNPEVQDRIHEEARETALLAPLADVRAERDRPVDGSATLSALPYTHRVFQEALRLYPTLPVFGRMAREHTEIGGYGVEADAPVLVSPYVTHRDPEFWTAPGEFDPGRFEADRPEFAYFPFSGGVHACLGRALATTEAVAALAAIFHTRRVELAAVDGTTIDDPPTGVTPDAVGIGVDSGINLQPDADVAVRFVERE
jgi:cytochrome P450